MTMTSKSFWRPRIQCLFFSLALWLTLSHCTEIERVDDGSSNVAKEHSSQTTKISNVVVDDYPDSVGLDVPHSPSTLSSSLLFAESHQQQQHTLTFGHSLLSSGVFLLNYTNFNHGSFGACPRHVLQHQLRLRIEQEQQPDLFLRKSYKQYWNTTRARVAQMWNTSYRNIALVESASTAVNSILRSLEFWNSGSYQVSGQNEDGNRNGPPILIQFSTSYGMVKNTNEWLHRHYGVEILTVPINFPIDNDVGKQAYLQPLNTTLRSLQQKDGDLNRLKVVVIDHIVSIPAVIVPVLEMSQLVRSYCDDVFILVDGAHAMGQVPRREIATILNTKRASCNENTLLDAYLSNGHKWMYAPKGSAVLWVAPSLVTKNFPEPTVISSENSFSSNTRSDGLAQLNDEYVYDVVYDRSLSKAQNEDADVDVDGADTDADPLYHRYVYTSTKDYTAIVSLGAAIDFYDDMLGGEDMVYNYTRSLALQAKHYLVEKWKTQIMAPDDMEVFMFHVVLPPLTHDDDDDDETNKIEIAKELQQWLYDEKGMYVVIAQEPSSGLFYTRLSAQVYLQMDDFERLGDAVLEFLRR